ncbi:MAG: hypothetical protein OEY97_01185 [Nitrospirota bacterium]|nr:hypothetical protein [Nitrospirota bacterium]
MQHVISQPAARPERIAPVTLLVPVTLTWEDGTEMPVSAVGFSPAGMLVSDAGNPEPGTACTLTIRFGDNIEYAALRLRARVVGTSASGTMVSFSESATRNLQQIRALCYLSPHGRQAA